MDSNDIRAAFVGFFEERDHQVVPSSSLIPVDPTLLLTNAGMVQFKPYFLGEETAPYLRAVSIQKSFRTVDIDIVGTTTRHFTFFEMLGNFSFGDYFKEKAIPWSFDFVTERLGIDPDRLWFTVYDTDEEAAQIWIDDVGAPPDRVQRGGKDNFWQMGVAGPCGPSSEIFIDRGPEYGEPGGPIGGGEERYVELWNLVFMQNIQDVPYHVVGDLPAKSIDTGAGLDRLAMVLQGAANVFETDLVRPLIAAGERATGAAYGIDPGRDVSLRILADHGRSMTFLIGDGVVPSNEGRGYVLRRLLRRAVRHAWRLGGGELVTPQLVAATIDIMGIAYPDLVSQRDFIIDMVEREEQRFRRTLESGHGLLEDEIEAMGSGDELSGETAFRLHDTFGFPVELTEEIAAERGIGLNRTEFETMMEQQRDRARMAWKGGDLSANADLYRGVLDEIGPTDFLGYEAEASEGRLLALLREGELVERADVGQEIEVFMDRTPFYAESGGQVGDVGHLVTETGRIRVIDTQFGVPGLHGHRGEVLAGYVQVGQDMSAAIDADRRERIRKSHTGTHLLHWGLRDVLGSHVHQAGSLVDAGRLRFDFSHYAGVAPDELLAVEQTVNDRIIENAAVHTFETSKEEAEKLGALAFFGDKYGHRVRVVETGSYSRELCGGTHVPTTGQVGPLVLMHESSIGSNMRRVEALTGATAYAHLIDLRRRLTDVSDVLRARPDTVVDAAEGVMGRLRDQEERLAAFGDQDRANRADALIEAAEARGEYQLIVASMGEAAVDELRALAMQARDRIGSGIVVLGATREGKGSLVVLVTPDLVDEGIAAGELAAGPARVLGGGGSRDPELSQAGGPHGDRLEDSLAEARTVARAALEKVDP